MGKNNLNQSIKDTIRQDPGRRSFVTVTTCRIWHAPRVNEFGSPAIGYYPNREGGPIVNAVELRAYAEFLNEFQTPGGKFYIDSEQVNELLAKRDQLSEQLTDPNLFFMYDNIQKELDRAIKDIDEVQGRIINKHYGEQLFAEENVKSFIVMSDGIVSIDYNDNPEAWEVITIGEFHEASYCYIKPAAGASAEYSTLVAEGKKSSEVTVASNKTGKFSDKVQNIKNAIKDEGGCREEFTSSDGNASAVHIRYPDKGARWIANSIMLNPITQHSAFFRGPDPSSKFLESSPAGKIDMSASSIEMHVDPRAIAIGDYVENPLQTSGASNIVTPVSRFRPRLGDLNFIAGVYNAIQVLLEQLESRNPDYSFTIERQHEVIDYNNFIPPGRRVAE